ncbi:MAG TPA: hypothetical protein VFZ64_14455 [Nocardioidaceae bacterium]
MTTPEVAEVVGASSLAEVCWVDGAGLPQTRGVVALVRDDRPVLAFTYADEAVARDVAEAGRVALALSEPRSTGGAFRPMLLSGRPRLVEDPKGELYLAELVRQELHRYPPARIFADSPLLMREHWWFLPRLVVELDVEAVQPIEPRTGDQDHLLVVADGGTPVVRVAGIREDAEGRLALSVGGGPVPPGPAILFGQDASFPDLEQWAQWRYRGTWDGTVLTVDEAPARTGLAGPLGLMQRWRRQRALEKACVQAIPRS